MTDFFRFPQTPHLTWLGQGRPRDDKVLSDADVQALLAGEVVVEEKVDGANLGLSTSEEGHLQVQNRGAYLDPEQSPPQFRPLWPWLTAREEGLVDALWPDLILFGEWCYAVHSVAYDRLPDWFLGFDVYDRSVGRFWSSGRRNGLCARAGLHVVPSLGRGRFTLGQLCHLLKETSRVGGGPIEGIVVRREDDGFTAARAKLVRAEFAQAIEQHWSAGPLRRNEMAQEVLART